MKKVLLLAISCTTIFSSVQSQNYVRNFDGVDDYVDLGSTVATGVRTIEMWFNPTTAIDASLSDYVGLISRDISSTNHSNEFGIAFAPSTVPNSGAISFINFSNSGVINEVFSNANQWNANQWYHVAAVIHPSQGMMLFIDGVKQSSTNSYTLAPTANSAPTTVASWGSRTNRYFNGKIDDFRLSSTALYTNNFTPSCPDLTANSSTLTLLNFNDSSNVAIAMDSSSNNNNGIIYGASRINEDVCPVITNIVTSTSEINKLVTVYPNPSKGLFTFEMNSINENYVVHIYSSSGKKVREFACKGNNRTIDLSGLPNGMYFYSLIENNKTISSNKLLKN